MSGVPALLSTREKVHLIEAELRKLAKTAGIPSDAAQIPTKHFCWGGIYVRQITAPGDTILVGEIHKYPNLNFLLKGKLYVLIDDGLVLAEAPMMIPSSSGVKRIAYTLEETIWMTCLPTYETDPETIERIFIAKSEEDYQQFLALARTETPACLS